MPDAARPRTGLRAPLDEPDGGDGLSEFPDLEAANYDGLENLVAIDRQGTLAARGAASDHPRSFYFATDANLLNPLSRSTGTAWVDIALGAASVPIGGYVDLSGPAADSADGRFMVPDGRVLNRADYPALLAYWGGPLHGFTSGLTFKLPDRGRRVHVPSSSGHAPGEAGGEENHQLSITELPQHTHTFQLNVVSANRQNGTTNAPGTGLTNAQTGAQGNDVAHNNMQPYLVGGTLLRVR